METKRRKITRRRRSKTSNEQNFYITRDTEAAIVSYNKSNSKIEKEKLFESHIRRPLEKLIENIVFKYRSSNLEKDKHLKNNLMAKLVINLEKFDPKKGKAFSYFGAAVKNELLSLQKEQTKFISINEGIDYNSNGEYDETFVVGNSATKIMQEEYEYETNQKELLSGFIASIRKLMTELSILSPNKKERMFFEAMHQILGSYEDVNISSSKHNHSMLRSITTLNLKDISLCNKKLKDIYKKYKPYYLNSNNDVNEFDFAVNYLKSQIK